MPTRKIGRIGELRVSSSDETFRVNPKAVQDMGEMCLRGGMNSMETMLAAFDLAAQLLKLTCTSDDPEVQGEEYLKFAKVVWETLRGKPPLFTFHPGGEVV